MLATDLSYNNAASKIIVALDLPQTQALACARKLIGKAQWLKVGMTLFYEAGPTIVQNLKEMGFKVFLDLKLHDIPHQVEGAAFWAAASGADLLSVHALGGEEMLAAARCGVERAHAQALNEGARFAQRTQLVGISVLTSMNQEGLARIGVTCALTDEVLRLVELARTSCDGMVCSAQEAALVAGHVTPGGFVVTPGIRLAAQETQDQARVCTPAAALAAGATHLVVGRPITQAQDVCAAFDLVVKDICTANAPKTVQNVN